MRPLLCFVGAVLLTALPATSDVLITEFMASNQEVLADGDGDSPDWVEVFNSGAEAVELDGYFLTDDLAELTKWRMPARVLEPNGFLVVFASGKNRAVAGEELHTNFSLAAGGDALALVAPDGVTVLSQFAFPGQFEDVSYGVGQTGATTPRVLVSTGANCRWLTPGDDSVDNVWTDLGFDDSGWEVATTGIGFETGSGYQSLFGTNGDVGALSAPFRGVYFRVPFTVANPSGFSGLELRMKYDDGFIAYLNGERVSSGNGPASPAWDSFSTGSHDDGLATSFEDHDLVAHITDLVEGDNVLAIHLMNTSAGSSDLLAIPELHGVEITDPSIGGEGYLAVASPGSFNGDTFGGFVRDTKFSVKRGFYDEPFDLEITSGTEGAEIRYTLNGEAPTAISGTVYTGPVRIGETTVLRAAAFKAGQVPTDVDTQTYVFVDDVVEQDAAQAISAGLPASWGGQSPDYGLDTRVTEHPVHSQTIKDDLKTIPSLSIVMDADDMFGSSGIYSNPGNRGSAWERATSLELIDPEFPDGSKDFQIDCAIRIQGGAFRSFGLSLKKSFRVLFKSEFGPSKLRYPFFGPDAADEFDTLTFRMEANDGYQWGNRTNVQYARDEWGRRTQLAMGWPAGRGRYMHIYINGVYWGVYNTVERPDAAFGETYFDGAKKEEWDGLNRGSSINEGNLSAWNTMNSILGGIPGAGSEAERTAIYLRSQGLNPDGSDDPASEAYINVDNYIDYLLVNWYAGNADWPGNNWYSGRARGPESTGYHFFMWDAEWTLFLNSSNDRTGNTSGVAAPYGDLRNSLEFRMRFGDRAHRALFNEGPLTPGPCVERWVDITKEHSSFLVGELARWGDQHGTLRTIQNWESANAQIRDQWMATRTPGFVEVLRGAGLYPETDAPVFSQHGGSVSTDTPVTMATDADRIYYTLDGSDPRLLGGAPDPAALVASFGGGGPVATTFMSSGYHWKYLDDNSDLGTAWRAVGFDDSGWEDGPSPLGYGGDGEATTVGFGGDGGNKYPTTYFRTTVEIPDPSVFVDFLVRLRYDDAAAVYLNGDEIIRTANLPAGAAAGDYATSTATSEGSWYDFTLPTTAFRAGENTLAVEVHQASGSSSDLRMDLVVRGEVSPGGGANVSDPVLLGEATTLTARSFNSGSGEWSALNSAYFTIDTVPADATNLVISEMHYRPENPTEAAELAVSADRDDYEFIELENIGGQAVDLSGVRFLEGIEFTFPERSQLEAGGRVVLVRSLAAFGVRYPGVEVFGEYGGRLSNDGEVITLLDGSGGELRTVSYNDQSPWPTAADGGGVSLVLVAAGTNPDHELASSWRPSAATGGSPGASDVTVFSGGVDELVGYALGGDAGGIVTGLVEMGGEFFPGVTIPRNYGAEDVDVVVEYSVDLVNWTVGAVLESAATGEETWRSTVPFEGRAYWRVRVAEKE